MKNFNVKVFLSLLISMGLLFSNYTINAQDDPEIDVRFTVSLDDFKSSGYTTGETLKIRWQDATLQKVQIRIYKNGEYVTTAAYGKQSAEGINAYDWDIPSTYSIGTYTIRLQQTANTPLLAEKDFKVNAIEIFEPAKVELLNENFKEVDYFDSNKHIFIMWNLDDFPKAGISIWKYDTYIKTVTWNQEHGSYALKINDHLDLDYDGNGFKIKIVNCDNPSEYVWSKNFSVYIGNRLAINQQVILTNNPNPVKDYSFISYNIPQQFEDASLNIYDMTGKLIQSKTLLDQNGIYYFKPSYTTTQYLFYSIVADGKTIARQKMLIQ